MEKTQISKERERKTSTILHLKEEQENFRKDLSFRTVWNRIKDFNSIQYRDSVSPDDVLDILNWADNDETFFNSLNDDDFKKICDRINTLHLDTFFFFNFCNKRM